MTLTLEKPAFAVNTPERDGQPAEFHWTVESYYKAAGAGSFGYDSKTELIHGRILEKMPQGPRHSWLITCIAQMLRQAEISSSVVREEKPIHIASDGEPEPDIAVVTGNLSDYQNEQPTAAETLLAVEVAVSSVEYDTGEKALLYAQAGITDYWVVLAEASAILVHRQPTLGGYQSVSRLVGDDLLSPLAAPNTTWTVNALLGRQES